MILVTGGAGFIGSNFVLDWLAHEEGPAVTLDRLGYAANPSNLAAANASGRHRLVVGDIADRELVGGLLRTHHIRAVVHFAAESHVDRSLDGPAAFVDANIVGTFHLLEAVRAYWAGLPRGEAEAFRFLHVSTDEIYGSLDRGAPAFTEAHPHAPNSPYAASKAASDHLVRAWSKSFGLPVITTNCSNNYGPFQYPEKLIPLMLLNALEGAPLPIYGDGQQRRDWLFVGDHIAALRLALARGRLGETYNIGGGCELANLELAHRLCALLDELYPRADGQPHAARITHVADRPGHDRRYAVDAGKIARELGWAPAESFESGLRKTVAWYLDHPEWVAQARGAGWRDWVARNYAAR